MEEFSFGRYLNAITRRLHVYDSRNFHINDLGVGKIPFLMVIYHHEGICQEKLSKMLSVDKTTSTKALNKLIEKGYITKVRGKEDKRFYQLFLTEKGQETVPEILKTLKASSELLVSGLDKEDREKLEFLLKKVLNNINNALNDERGVIDDKHQ